MSFNSQDSTIDILCVFVDVLEVSHVHGGYSCGWEGKRATVSLQETLLGWCRLLGISIYH